LIIDDVISAGTSVRESMDIIKANEAEAAGVIIALDRQEVGKGNTTAIQEVEKEFKVPVISIVCLGNLINYLETENSTQEQIDAIKAYREKYGVS